MIAFILAVLFWLGMVATGFLILCAPAAEPRNRKRVYLVSGVGLLLCTIGFLVAGSHSKPIFSHGAVQNGCAQVQQM